MMNETEKLKVALLFGGKAVEHEISIKSALYIAGYLDPARFDLLIVYIDKDGRVAGVDAALEAIIGLIGSGKYTIFGDEDTVRDDFREWITDGVKRGGVIDSIGKLTKEYIDIVFPVFHGQKGEDGIVQGILEFNDIPYVGCGITASIIANDKERLKKIARSAGIRVTDFAALTPSADGYEQEADVVIDRLGLPLFVKPPNLGSSIGITKASTKKELVKGIKNAFKYGDRVIIEQAVVGQEYGICVTGDSIPEFSVPARFQSCNEYLDYDAKYGANALPDEIPGSVDQATLDRLYQAAGNVYREFDLSGMSRIDFFVTENGEILLNEINTVPGFGAISIYNRAWRASGVPIAQLLEKLVTYGFARYERKAKLEYSKYEHAKMV